MLWDDRPYLPAAGARMMRVGVENIHTDVGKTAMAQVTRPSRTSFTPQHRGGGSRPVTAAWKRTVAAVDGGLQMLWRIQLGWLTGRALLVLTHVGRRTGKHYRTVLYVQRCDERTCEATVIVAWGDSRWFRNISAAHAAQVEIGLQRYAPDQRFLTTEEIVELEKSFRTRHRIIAWGQAKLMGWPWPATEEQLQNLCSGLRAVAFAPRSRGVGADPEPAGTQRPRWPAAPRPESQSPVKCANNGCPGNPNSVSTALSPSVTTEHTAILVVHTR